MMIEANHGGRGTMNKSITGYCKIRFVSKYHHGAPTQNPTGERTITHARLSHISLHVLL